MKKYVVSIPFCGYVSIEVEANSQTEAIEVAWESEDLKISNAEDVEFFKEIVKGNVFYGQLSKIEVEEL